MSNDHSRLPSYFFLIGRKTTRRCHGLYVHDVYWQSR